MAQVLKEVGWGNGATGSQDKPVKAAFPTLRRSRGRQLWALVQTPLLPVPKIYSNDDSRRGALTGSLVPHDPVLAKETPGKSAGASGEAPPGS